MCNPRDAKGSCIEVEQQKENGLKVEYLKGDLVDGKEEEEEANAAKVRKW